MLKSHGLLESEHSASSDGGRGQRRERLTERRKLHQLKRDHEQREGTRRKVLRLDEGQDEEFSSGSDTEKAGRSKKDKEGSGQNLDIQVNSEYSVRWIPTKKPLNLPRTFNTEKQINIYKLSVTMLYIRVTTYMHMFLKIHLLTKHNSIKM